MLFFSFPSPDQKGSGQTRVWVNYQANQTDYSRGTVWQWQTSFGVGSSLANYIVSVGLRYVIGG